MQVTLPTKYGELLLNVSQHEIWGENEVSVAGKEAVFYFHLYFHSFKGKREHFHFHSYHTGNISATYEVVRKGKVAGYSKEGYEMCWRLVNFATLFKKNLKKS